MIDVQPNIMQLKRLSNDPAMDHRHRRIVQETLRMMNAVDEELSKAKQIEELFENNERLQRVLAEELEKQNA
jgi:hypothetical protein